MSAGPRPRRGAMMIELIVSVALFVGAAAFTLKATSGVLTALHRADREQEAIDLARTKLAELEAGIIGINDLRDGEITRAGSVDDLAGDEGPAPGRLVWRCEVSTQRSDFPGLSLVTLTVTESPSWGQADRGANAPEAVRFTLRELVALRAPLEETFEEDDLVQDLPEPDPEPAPETFP